MGETIQDDIGTSLQICLIKNGKKGRKEVGGKATAVKGFIVQGRSVSFGRKTESGKIL